MSTPGGTSITSVRVPADVGEHSTDVLRPDERRPGGRQGLGSPGRELGVSSHRVFELGPVRLDGERDADAAPTGPPRRTWFVNTTSAGSRARIAEAFASTQPSSSLAGAILETPHLVSVVAIEDEDRQQAADVGTCHRCAAEVVAPGVRFLREHCDLVPGSAPLPGEHPGVHVRAGAPEKVSVPEQDAHGACLPKPPAPDDGPRRRRRTVLRVRPGTPASTPRERPRPHGRSVGRTRRAGARRAAELGPEGAESRRNASRTATGGRRTRAGSVQVRWKYRA